MRTRSLIIIFVILVIGGFALSYSVGPERHEDLIASAFAGFGSAESMSGRVHFETIGLLPIEGISDDPFRVPVSVEGPLVVGFAPDGQLRGTAELTLGPSEIDDPETQMHMSWIAADDGSAYMRLADIAEGGDESLLSMTELEGRWLRLDPQVTAELVGRETVVGNLTGRGYGPLYALGPLRDAIANGTIVGSAEQMVNEVVDGVPTWHYRIALHRPTFQDVMANMKSIAFARGLIEEDFRSIDALWEERGMRFEVWIDKELKTIRQFGFDIGAAELGDAPVRLIVTIDEYGVEVEPNVPEGAEDLEKVLFAIVGKSDEAGE